MLDKVNQKNYEEYQLKRKIGIFLDKLQMKHSSIGYCYWQNAILYYLQEFKRGNVSIKMKEIYDYISKIYKTTRNRSEKAMRWSRENSKYLQEFSQYSYKITNKEFLILCAERLQENVS